MAATDEDALACDFAQVYHILDWRRLPLRAAAVFAQGLPEDSRIMRRLSGAPVRLETLLLAHIADYLALLWWAKTEDGQHGRHRPESISNLLLGTSGEKPARGFESPAAFMAAWATLSGGET